MKKIFSLLRLPKTLDKIKSEVNRLTQSYKQKFLTGKDLGMVLPKKIFYAKVDEHRRPCAGGDLLTEEASDCLRGYLASSTLKLISVHQGEVNLVFVFTEYRQIKSEVNRLTQSYKQKLLTGKDLGMVLPKKIFYAKVDQGEVNLVFVFTDKI